MRDELTTSINYGRKFDVEQYLDLNDDGVENDTRVCKPFNLTEPFNPPPMCPRDKKWANYRDDRPSGQFYGGISANFLNVSHLTRTNSKGKEEPAIMRYSQDTVQNDGASPNLYKERYPHNTMRALNSNSDLFWADMTLFVVDPEWTRTAQSFYSVDDAAVNFSALFMWKKADFVNGGASADKIVFDKTSNIMVDLTRHWVNIEDARFVLQDGDQLWISEYQFKYLEAGHTIALNPLDSRWAKYEPQDCDMAIDADTLEFEKHEFTDVQAVGTYLASYSYLTSDRDPESLVFIFDNFQLYATTEPTDDKAERNFDSVDVKLAPSLALDSELQPTQNRSLFSVGVAVNGRSIQARASDQLDIRGVIRPDTKHIGQKADIIALVGYAPSSDTPPEQMRAFMINSIGELQPWDNKLENLVALEPDITLTPEYRVQLFPVSIARFKNELTMDSVVLSCDERPATYTGVVGIPGILQFFYAYRLETGELVYSRQPITVELLPDPVVEEPEEEAEDNTVDTSEAENSSTSDATPTDTNNVDSNQSQIENGDTPDSATTSNTDDSSSEQTDSNNTSTDDTNQASDAESQTMTETVVTK